MSHVYFGTNRDPSPKATPRNFGKHFNPDGIAALRFGRASVDGNKGTVEVEPETLAKAAGTNTTDTSRSKLGSASLFDDLRKRMKRGGSDTVVFVHGYNVSFKEAMKSAAHLARNLASVNGGKGVHVLAFSWPSDGSMAPWLAYTSDRHDASASGAALARGLLKLRDFVQELSDDEACEQRVHLVAHSMGNFVLRHALQEVRRHTADALPRLFDQVFLMAADEDDDAFEHDHKLRLLPRLARRVNVYFNRNDRAMSISDATKGNPDRLGDDGPRAPFQVPAKVTQVDCTEVVEGIVEHSYFLETQAVVDDMLAVLAGLDPMVVPGRRFLDDRNRFVIEHPA